MSVVCDDADDDDSRKHSIYIYIYIYICKPRVIISYHIKTLLLIDIHQCELFSTISRSLRVLQ